MYQLNFNQERTNTAPMVPVNRALGRIIGEMEVSEGINPWVAAYPFKFLPIMIVDNQSKQGTVDMRQGIVLLKGTIVSALTNQSRVYGTSDAITSGIPCVSGNGEIPVWDNAQNAGVDWVYTSIDNSFFGYEDDTTCLLVAANGGATTYHYYSALDESLLSWNSQGDSLTLGANYPVGVVYQDIYQDIRGKGLNYEQDYTVYTYAARGYIRIPFVDTSDITDFGSSSDLNTGTKAGQTTTNVYYDVWRNHAFAYGSSFEAGSYLKSDSYGKWVPDASPVGAQTVGQVKTVDSRFPKDLMDTVDTYTTDPPVTGLKTAGVSADLYNFAYDVLSNTSVAAWMPAVAGTPTAAEVQNAIKQCVFGFVYISILL